MAKADDPTSKIDGIWLREALELAVAAHGSEVRAKELLREWMAAGKLPWSCALWRGLDAEGRARLEHPSGKILFHIALFWGADITVNWEDNWACENAVDGARAWGIAVSRTHLLALLPEEPREREQVHGAGAWIAAEAKRMKAAGEILDGIKITDFAKKLERRMLKTAASDKSLRPIKWRSIKNRLPEWGLWPVTSIK